MITETLTYVDFGGTERTEDFYFNLTEAEVLNLSLSKEGGMEAYIKKIVNAKSQLELVKLFQDVLRISYGKKRTAVALRRARRSLQISRPLRPIAISTCRLSPIRRRQLPLSMVCAIPSLRRLNPHLRSQAMRLSHCLTANI